MTLDDMREPQRPQAQGPLMLAAIDACFDTDRRRLLPLQSGSSHPAPIQLSRGVQFGPRVAQRPS
jgi:hypothetical protein